MEQRHVYGKSQWYHETQARKPFNEVLPLVPEAAHITDRLLLDLTLTEALYDACNRWLTPARVLAGHLLPDDVTVSRLNTFSLYERLSTALTVAQVFGVQRLCNHYAARLTPLPGPDSSRESNHRLAQITQYARQLASSPSIITGCARQQLESVGLSHIDIILINQIIGFIGFQARIVAVFQAMPGQAPRRLPVMPVQDDASATLFTAPASEWQTAIAPVDPLITCQKTLAAVTRCQSCAELCDLAPVLAHDDVVLNSLIALFSALDVDPQRAVLASLVAARINGSPSCFHDQVENWQGDPGLPDAICSGSLRQVPAEFQDFISATQWLTRAPERFSEVHLFSLTTHTDSVMEAIQLLARCSLSGWVNRLKIGLGEASSLT